MTAYMEMKRMAEAAERNRLEVQSKLDRVTAERDAALLELSEIKESLAYRGSLLCLIEGQRDAALEELSMVRKAVPNSTLELVSLQQRLTAADERVDVLESALALLIKVTPRNKSSFADKRRAMEILAALKPEDGHGDE
jgi:molybdopterin-guanine dinucleotide biosynthesis protein